MRLVFCTCQLVAGVGLLSAGVFVVGTEVGWSDQWAVMWSPSQARQKGKSKELTTGLDNNNRPLYSLSLRIVGFGVSKSDKVRRRCPG